MATYAEVRNKIIRPVNHKGNICVGVGWVVSNFTSRSGGGYIQLTNIYTGKTEIVSWRTTVGQLERGELTVTEEVPALVGV